MMFNKSEVLAVSAVALLVVSMAYGHPTAAGAKNDNGLESTTMKQGWLKVQLTKTHEHAKDCGHGLIGWVKNKFGHTTTLAPQTSTTQDDSGNNSDGGSDGFESDDGPVRPGTSIREESTNNDQQEDVILTIDNSYEDLIDVRTPF